jgi:hypothetical protein
VFVQQHGHQQAHVQVAGTDNGGAVLPNETDLMEQKSVKHFTKLLQNEKNRKKKGFTVSP